MALTPYDLQLADDPIVCTNCNRELHVNERAITYHHTKVTPFMSTIICEDCVSPVLGSLIQDWAKLLAERPTVDNPQVERDERVAKAAEAVASDYRGRSRTW